jgi:hypothetical protein
MCGVLNFLLNLFSLGWIKLFGFIFVYANLEGFKFQNSKLFYKLLITGFLDVDKEPALNL